VLVAGGANLDVVACADPLRPGESNPGVVRLGPGGAARNVAGNLARLGAAVQLVCPSAGPVRDLVLAPAEAAGVVVHAVAVRAAFDTYVAVLSRGERAWAVSDTRGCEALSPQHLHEALRQRGAPDAVVADANLSEEFLKAVAALETPRCLLPVSPAKAARLRPILAGTWLLVCGAREAEVLCGRPVRDPEEAQVAARQLQQAGCAHVVVTLGPQGLVWCGGRDLWAKAPHVPVADPTGAGDAVAACAAFALLSGYGEPEVVRLCVWAGALTVQVEGSTNPNLTLEGLCERAGVEFRG
jgi:pseudouridine kinase